MYKLEFSLFKATVLAIFLVGQSAHASGFNFSLKAGYVAPDINDYDPISAGTLLVGYDLLDLLVLDLGLEAGITRSLSEADSPQGMYEYRHNVLYATLRTAGPVYFIARSGKIADSRIKTANITSLSPRSNVYGLGIGFSAGIVRLEIDLSVFQHNEDDVYQINLNLNY